MNKQRSGQESTVEVPVGTVSDIMVLPTPNNRFSLNKSYLILEYNIRSDPLHTGQRGLGG